MKQEYLQRLREKYRHTHLHRRLLQTEYELVKGDKTIPESERAGLQQLLAAKWNEELLLETRIAVAEGRINRPKLHEVSIPSEVSLRLSERLAS